MKILKNTLWGVLLMMVSLFNIAHAQETKTAVVKMYVDSEGTIVKADTTYGIVDNIDSLVKTIKCNVVLNDEVLNMTGSDSAKYCIYIQDKDIKKNKKHKCNKEEMKVVVIMNEENNQVFEGKEIDKIISTCCGESDRKIKCKHIKVDAKECKENQSFIIVTDDSENKKETTKTIEIKEGKENEPIIIIIK